MIDCPYIQSIQVIIKPGFFSYAKPHGPTGGMDKESELPQEEGTSQSVSWMQAGRRGRESGGHTYLD